jgi:hypothetical protein
MLLVSVALSAIVAACGAFEESPATPTPDASSANLLVDAGFEGAAPGWVAFPPAGADEISKDEAHSGRSSMALHLSPQVPALSVTQSLNPAAFPEFLSGYYRVDRWPRGRGYLQFVVKAPGGTPDEVREVRFIIAGAASDPDPPPHPPNVFLDRDGPPTDEWTYFAYPIAQAFQSVAGGVPQAWNSIDISVEAHQTADAGPVTAYFDDLYVGPQLDNPNRPKESTK